MIDRAIGKLRNDYEKSGRGELFAELSALGWKIDVLDLGTSFSNKVTGVLEHEAGAVILGNGDVPVDHRLTGDAVLSLAVDGGKLAG